MNFDLPELTPETPQGALCQVKVSELKPTQNAVGFDEVNDKIARYSAKSKEDLRDYLLVHSVPIVIGNGGQILPDRSSPHGQRLVEDGGGREQGRHRYRKRARGGEGAIQPSRPGGLSLLPSPRRATAT